MFALKKSDRIQVPWRTRWQLFRHRVLPVLGFLVTLLIAGRLWIHQGSLPNAVGRVEAERVNIAAAFDGKLMLLEDLPGGRFKPFDLVQKGQILARLDDAALQAELVAVGKDAEALRSQLAAAQVEAEWEHDDRQLDLLGEASALAYQIERYRLQVLDQQAQVEEARLQLQQLDVQIDMLQRAQASGIGTLENGRVYKANRAVLEKLLDSRISALRQAEANLAAAEKRRRELPTLAEPDFNVLIAPIRNSIEAAQARVAQVRAQMDALVIRSPIDGMIRAVHAHPGQGVRAGEWILTVAANEADSIIGYVPQRNRFRPVEGMSAGVRLRMPGSPMLTTTVQRVAPQSETMPVELAKDPQTPQLALPVRLAVPRGLNVRPGEVVDIHFFQRDDANGIGWRSVSTFRMYASRSATGAASDGYGPGKL